MTDLCIHDIARCTICHEPKPTYDDSRPFVAMYDGTCPACDGDIAAGQTVLYVEASVVHFDCDRHG